MRKNDKTTKRVYHSLAEFEKEFLPDSYKKRFESDNEDDPETFGSKVAMELMKNIRQQLQSKYT